MPQPPKDQAYAWARRKRRVIRAEGARRVSPLFFKEEQSLYHLNNNCFFNFSKSITSNRNIVDMDSQRKTKPSNPSSSNRAGKKPQRKARNPKNPLIPREDLGYPKLVSDYSKFQQYAKQFMLPIDCGGAGGIRVSPAQTPSQLCARHIHRVVDVTSAVHPDGFVAIMSPDLFEPGLLSSPVASVIPAAGAGIVGFSLAARITAVGAATMEKTAVTFTASNGENAQARTSSTPDSVGTYKQALEVVPGAAQNGNFSFHQRLKGTTVLNVYAKVVAGPWVRIGGCKLSEGASGSSAMLLAANTNGLAFDFDAGSDSAPVEVSMTSTLNQFQLAANVHFAPAFEKFVADSRVTRGRVISMSILATNTSSGLNNGGNVTAARVPRDFNPVEGAVASVAELPANRRYQGPAQKGAYVTWCPSEFDEFQPDSVEAKLLALRQAEYLFLKVDGWGGGAAVSSYRLQFDWIVEFYTPNQLFEKIMTPPQTEEFNKFYYALQLSPCATCNPGHLDMLKNLLRKGVDTGRAAYKMYDDHKAFIDPAMAAILTALM